jgi:hypothetical protein
VLGDRRRVGLGLPRRGEAQILEHDRRHDHTDRLDVIEPLKIGITVDLHGHCAHPDAGQR